MSDNNGKSSQPKDRTRRLDEVTDKEILAVLPHVTGFRAASRTLGLGDNASVAARINLRVISLKGDTSHFLRDSGSTSTAIKPEVLFSRREKKHAPSALIERGIKEGLFSNHCMECLQGEEWHGKKLRWRLQQLNNDKYDNRIENLRVLCPNCYSQLPIPPGRSETIKAKRERKQYEAILKEERDLEDSKV